jgi:hypothetical protein
MRHFDPPTGLLSQITYTLVLQYAMTISVVTTVARSFNLSARLVNQELSIGSFDLERLLVTTRGSLTN